MFKTILYPTDFSEQSKKVLGYIKGLKGAGVKKVVVLHVVEKAYIDAYEEAFLWAGEDVEKRVEELKKKMVEKAEKSIDRIVDELKEFKVVKLIKIGVPHEEILKASQGMDLIVIASHGCGSVMCEIEKVIGSTAENVVRHSKVPVLVIR